MKKVKENKGSITLFVLLAILFFIVFLIGAYVSITNSQKGDINAGKQARKQYEDEIQNADSVYNSLHDRTEFLGIKPKITDGMTPVKWNGTKWEETTTNDSSWYNYENKQWANVKLQDGSMLVWIPRYAYKITSMVHKNGTGGGNIEVVFVDIDNKDKEGTSYSTTYPTIQNNAMTDYVVHPAFVNYDGKELSGIWVGKYESSNSNDNIKIAEGISCWRNINVNDIYNKCVSMKNSGNPYGIDESSDPHLLKNTEWGAVAYLAQSKYGKQAEVRLNDSSNFITGTGGTAASTTGNETGIYDMSGGANEYVAAYVDSGNSRLSNEGKSLYEASAKHKDVYKVGSPESQANDYNANSDKYGDAIWETSNSYFNNSSWYKDYSGFPYNNYPFFIRGNAYNAVEEMGGTFCFVSSDGAKNEDRSFRVCLVVL